MDYLQIAMSGCQFMDSIVNLKLLGQSGDSHLQSQLLRRQILGELWLQASLGKKLMRRQLNQ
jgi:hypothetical protein